ncbi:MAG TPA: A/G-specific adenine glycosylase [Kiloniellaceae bacterium]|nr:A/G-specific adenine glycosylase [Kiloniellaceae bacterium]
MARSRKAASPTRDQAAAALPEAADLARRLLAWYDRHARDLPWRAPPGAPPMDPYLVWLSEIMLQQTTVAAAGSYFAAFVARWPRVEDLAAASLDEVLTLWAGLGYYARARNLWRTAGIVAGELGGVFPDTEERLRALPGIGPYTAAAIAAIAFDRNATVVDGNVERVVARLFAVETPLPDAKSELRDLAGRLTPAERPGDFAQATMDLGATLCLVRRPKCMLCPWQGACRARAAGIESALPRRRPKATKPTRHAVAFFISRSDGAIYLQRRPEKGLLGGMMEPPSTAWRDTPWRADEVQALLPVAGNWREIPGLVRHGFTHFDFEISVWTLTLPDPAAGALRGPEGRWVLPDALGDEALPSVMRKILRHGLLAES